MSNETFKVICISADGNRNITIGKIYDAYHDDDIDDDIDRSNPVFYYIKNDNETWVAYFTHKFITLAEWRDEQIDKILEDD